ncbi:hypothetical protein AgCh_018423 [Apium graveolens]
MAMNQFKKKAQIIRSDNVLEFDDSKCKTLFDHLGIVHQIFCSDRPQQNGRVERKHRNILEMARALRFQAALPLQFWEDCVLVATHITNRLPTPLLKNKTPYELLYKKEPNYGYMRSFGCLAFAHNPGREKDKFKAKGTPCIFIGYSAKQKGYKLQNLLTGTSFVSRDEESESAEVSNQEVQQLRKSSRQHKAPLWQSDYHMSANHVQKVGEVFVTPQFSCFMAERYGIDYEKTFAPVAKLTTVRSILVVAAIKAYMDDLILTGNILPAIEEAKQFLNSQFKMKDLGELTYFLGIEVDKSEKGIFLSQKKYTADLLNEYNLLHCKPLRLPMDTYVKLLSTSGTPISNLEDYQRIIVMWVKKLLKELGLEDLGSTPIFCDNKAVLAIAADPVHHEKTKHVEIDCQFIRDKAIEAPEPLAQAGSSVILTLSLRGSVKGQGPFI